MLWGCFWTNKGSKTNYSEVVTTKNIFPESLRQGRPLILLCIRHLSLIGTPEKFLFSLIGTPEKS